MFSCGMTWQHVETRQLSLGPSQRQQSLTDGNIIQLIELVHQRPNDSDIDPHIAQLLQTEVILHYADDVAPYAVDVGVDGQMTMRIRHAAENLVLIYTSRFLGHVMVIRIQAAEERAALVRGWWQCDARPGAGGHQRARLLCVGEK